MRLVVDVAGSFRELLKDAGDNLAAVLTNAVAAAGADLQEVLRGQVRAAGLGEGLAKAWRYEAYPKGRRASLGPAALVYSKAARLHQVFETGATITARGSKWLVLPLPAAEALGYDTRPLGRKPGGRANRLTRWSNVDAAVARYGELRFVAFDGGRRALLIADNLSRARQRTVRRRLVGAGQLEAANRVSSGVPLFLLIRQVRVGKQLDIAGAVKQTESSLAARVEQTLKSV